MSGIRSRRTRTGGAPRFIRRKLCPLQRFQGTVAIGYDGRLGGDRFYEIAIDALITSGCDVFALGMVPTPTVMMAVETKPEIVGGIIITASHNPGE